jgi:hypothetical protein
MASLIEDAFTQAGRLFADNVELHLIVDNMATEWAVILEDGEVIGVFGSEPAAIVCLAGFDRLHPSIPAFIVSRRVGPWVKS